MRFTLCDQVCVLMTTEIYLHRTSRVDYDQGNLLDGLNPFKYAPKSHSMCSKCNLNVPGFMNSPEGSASTQSVFITEKNMNNDKIRKEKEEFPCVHIKGTSGYSLTNGNPAQDCA